MPDVVAGLSMQQSLVARNGLCRALIIAGAGRESWADLANMVQATFLKSWHKVAAHRRHYNQQTQKPMAFPLLHSTNGSAAPRREKAVVVVYCQQIQRKTDQTAKETTISGSSIARHASCIRCIMHSITHRHAEKLRERLLALVSERPLVSESSTAAHGNSVRA